MQSSTAILLKNLLKGVREFALVRMRSKSIIASKSIQPHNLQTSTFALRGSIYRLFSLVGRQFQAPRFALIIITLQKSTFNHAAVCKENICPSPCLALFHCSGFVLDPPTFSAAQWWACMYHFTYTECSYVFNLVH